jgi:hypothetical protein
VTSPTALGKLSAVAPGPATFPAIPPPQFTTGSWKTQLADNTQNHQGGRALVYGYPVTTSPIVYEWATIAPATVFHDYAIVSICDGQSGTDLMLHESSQGVIAFTEANLCGLPDATGTTTKSGFKSQFKTTPVTAVTLAYQQGDAPPAKQKVNADSTIVVRATTTVQGFSVPQGVNGTCLTVTGSNNNGLGTMLVGPEECGKKIVGDNEMSVRTDNGGFGSFTYHVTKSGNLYLTLTGDVIGRDGQAFNTIVTKTNIVP